MQDLLQEFQGFNFNTKTQLLISWAKNFEKNIATLDDNQKGYFFLLLSQLNAIYLRNILQAKNILKSIRNPKYPLSEQIKIRRCFYKYLQGDYQNACQSLQELVANSSSFKKKISKDFFSRIYFKDNYTSFGKNQSKDNRKQSYQIEFLKAIKQQRKGLLKVARDIHKQIIANYGDLDQAIKFESAQHILMLFNKEKLKPNRQEIQKYTEIVSNYQEKNIGYYKQKVQFIMKVMDLIEDEGEQSEQQKKYQLAKEFIVDKLKKAIAEEQDQEILQKFKSVLNALKQSKTSGGDVCFKFLDDKQIIQMSKLKDKKSQSKVKIKQSKIPKTFQQNDQQYTKSKMSKTPIRSKIKHIEQDSQQQQEIQQHKSKKTPIRMKSLKVPESQENYEKNFNQYEEQQQQVYNGKSKVKNQNQQKYLKFSIPDSNDLRKNRKNSKYDSGKQIKIEQSEQQNLKSKSKIKGKDLKQTNMKRTNSRIVQKNQIDPDFKGSNMIKINYNSSGNQQRYFYFKQDFEESMKLYFCSKKQKKSSSDQYYRLKGLKKITLGKKSDALKRSECEDFSSQLCFTLYITTADEDYERNFYVKQKEDYEQWVNQFKYLLSKKDLDNMKMKSKLVVKVK